MADHPKPTAPQPEPPAPQPPRCHMCSDTGWDDYLWQPCPCTAAGDEALQKHFNEGRPVVWMS